MVSIDEKSFPVVYGVFEVIKSGFFRKEEFIGSLVMACSTEDIARQFCEKEENKGKYKISPIYIDMLPD